MSHDVAISVVTLLLVLRVFGPDLLSLLRRVLGAGVRVGAAALAEQHHRSMTTARGTVSLREGEEQA
ncbi:hypothetical protein [Streptomyces litchfieldiae]|uniref:Uncharacterized protein n=1 Tax=Streptomyces litchfieldiae TaxID=3075543 RepID=A0ABU2N0L3_9ACTN|nr:hypothetical protein [Streptomyces sp. DSM 44938]MDT0347142.1 hypothetical protein [Streptomyces sp. DSM 44938]